MRRYEGVLLALHVDFEGIAGVLPESCGVVDEGRHVGGPVAAVPVAGDVFPRFEQPPRVPLPAAVLVDVLLLKHDFVHGDCYAVVVLDGTPLVE